MVSNKNNRRETDNASVTSQLRCLPCHRVCTVYLLARKMPNKCVGFVSFEVNKCRALARLFVGDCMRLPNNRVCFFLLFSHFSFPVRPLHETSNRGPCSALKFPLIQQTCEYSNLPLRPGTAVTVPRQSRSRQHLHDGHSQRRIFRVRDDDEVEHSSYVWCTSGVRGAR